jgi:prepilin-type N-terminal cleavage/methylation domain-containing protein
MRSKASRNYTLLELLVVTAVIGILSDTDTNSMEAPDRRLGFPRFIEISRKSSLA